MTRINAGIKPYDLCDSHLLAEIRELPRILNTIKSGRAKIEDLPKKFTLGKGHVKWFYNKLDYLINRHKSLIEEAQNRGFNIMDYNNSYKDLPKELLNNWFPTYENSKLVINRINERLSNMKKIKYKKTTNKIRNN
jgi:hypothetical protein